MPAHADRFAPDEARIAAEVVDGEALVIDLTTGVYYSMDKVAGVIWALIEQRYSLGEIIEIVSARYNIPAEQAQADVAQMVSTLLQEELIMPADGDRLPGEALPATETLPYATPEVTIYRDMSALLALDPPMPGLKVKPWRDPRQEQA
jgi:hypothetical protein